MLSHRESQARQGSSLLKNWEEGWDWTESGIQPPFPLMLKRAEEQEIWSESVRWTIYFVTLASGLAIGILAAIARGY